jgi:hypothetical protein
MRYSARALCNLFAAAIQAQDAAVLAEREPFMPNLTVALFPLTQKQDVMADVAMVEVLERELQEASK